MLFFYETVYLLETLVPSAALPLNHCRVLLPDSYSSIHPNLTLPVALFVDTVDILFNHLDFLLVGFLPHELNIDVLGDILPVLVTLDVDID